MDKQVRLSDWPDELTDAIINRSMVAREGDIVIITAGRDWTPFQCVKYMEHLHAMTLALGLQFSFMIVHGQEVTIENAATNQAAARCQAETGDSRPDEAERSQPG